MLYPYDGIRSLIEYDKNYIQYLEEENKRLKEENDKFLYLLIKYEIIEMQEKEEIKRR